MPKPSHLRHLIAIDDEAFDALPAVAQQALTQSAQMSSDALTQYNVRAVTTLYDYMRSLPHISAMSSDQVTSAAHYVRNAYSHASNIANIGQRNDYMDMIRYISRAGRCMNAVDTMPAYDVHHTPPHEVRFQSRVSRLWRSYVMSSSSMQVRSPVVITDATTPGLCIEINKVIADVKRTYGACREYQVTLAAHNGSELYYNSTPSTLMADLARVSEEYDGAFYASSVTIKFTHGDGVDDIVRTSSIEAGYGEGVPYRITAYGSVYWVMDIIASRKYCVLYARHIWGILASHSSAVDGLTVPCVRRQMMREWVADLHSTGMNFDDNMCSIAAIQHLYPCSYRVITSRSILERTLPTTADTLSTCHYYYDCGHVAVLVTDTALSAHMRRCLEHMAHKTVLSRMHPAKHISCAVCGIAVLDIECYRQPMHTPVITLRSMQRATHGTYTHVPVLVGLLVDDVYTVHKGRNCVQQLFDYMVSRNWADNEVTIWVHNGGKYDVCIMLNDILCNAVHVGREPVRVVDANGALINVQFHMDTPYGHTLSVTFKDSYRLMPVSLDKLAASYDISGKVQCDIVNVTESRLLHDDTYTQYMEQDCRLLHTVLSRYRAECIDSGFSDPLAFSTQASYTRHVFLEHYYDASKPIYTLPRWLHTYIDRAYNGGRNEVYRYGVIQGPVHIYDFTSLYPHVGTFDMPYGVPRYSTIGVSPRGVLATCDNIIHMFGFVEVTIADTPRNIRPYYGIHKDGAYVFDYVHNQRVVMTTVELSRMVELGYTMYMHTAVQYSKAPILKRMFDALFTAKSDARSTSHALTAKLATVSAYGMFGFRKYDRRVLRVYHSKASEHTIARELSGLATHTRHDSGMLLVNERVHVRDAQCNVGIAAFITAYGRDTLYRLMTDIELHGGTVHYCDTDSVFTDYRIDQDPVLRDKWMGNAMGMRIGELKCEHSDVTEVVMAGLKAYGAKLASGEHMIKVKGINGATQDEDGYNRLRDACIQGATSINIASTVMKRGRDGTGITERTQPMCVSLVYTKGNVQSDGAVQPLSGRRK